MKCVIVGRAGPHQQQGFTGTTVCPAAEQGSPGHPSWSCLGGGQAFFPGCDAVNAELKTPRTALVPLPGLCQVTATCFYSRLEFGLTKYFQTLLQVPRTH